MSVTSEVLRAVQPDVTMEEGFGPSPSYKDGKLASIGPYVLTKTLGLGSTGYVKLGTHKESNAKVAVKIISKNNMCNGQSINLTKKLEREIAIMKLMNHNHIMKLYETYETEKEFFLVLEYVEGGELFDYLVEKGRLDEREACSFFQQIIFGLDYCHKHQICHRDLKPENLLLDNQNKIKIADFGMAGLQRSGKFLETSCGSPHYASPEIVRGVKYDGLLSDIWSCGVILFALLSGTLPFDDENIGRLLGKVKAGRYVMPGHISRDARDLIQRMLQVDPRRRAKMSEILQHPWFHLVPPAMVPHATVFRRTGTAPPIRELDEEIVQSMAALGWTEPAPLERALRSARTNAEKTLYHLFRERSLRAQPCTCTNPAEQCTVCVDLEGYAAQARIAAAADAAAVSRHTRFALSNFFRGPRGARTITSQASAVTVQPHSHSSDAASTATSSRVSAPSDRRFKLFSLWGKKKGKTYPLQKPSCELEAESMGITHSSTTMNNANVPEPQADPAGASACAASAATSPLSSSTDTSSLSLSKKKWRLMDLFKRKPTQMKLYSILTGFELLFSIRAALSREKVEVVDGGDGVLKCTYPVPLVSESTEDTEVQSNASSSSVVHKVLQFRVEMYKSKDEMVLRMKMKQGEFADLEDLVQRVLTYDFCYLKEN